MAKNKYHNKTHNSYLSAPKDARAIINNKTTKDTKKDQITKSDFNCLLAKLFKYANDLDNSFDDLLTPTFNLTQVNGIIRCAEKRSLLAYTICAVLGAFAGWAVTMLYYLHH